MHERALLMRDWKIWKRVNDGLNIWVDTDIVDGAEPEILRDSCPRSIVESKFLSSHPNWNSMSITERLEEIDKAKAFFAKIVSEESKYFHWEYSNISNPSVIEERGRFLKDLANAILLSNLTLIGFADVMESQEIYEAKRTVEEIILHTNETNSRIGKLISDGISCSLAEVYVSKDLMIEMDNLHLQKSSMSSKRFEKGEYSTNLLATYSKIWRLANEAIENIANTKKISPANWQASLAPLKAIKVKDLTAVSTSILAKDEPEGNGRRHSKGQSGITPTKDGAGVSANKALSPQQQWDSVSPNKLLSGYQPRSPVSPASKPLPADHKGPGVPPLPLKKKKSKKPRQFDSGTG